MKKGPVPNYKKDKQVLMLRKKKISFRDIAKIVGEDVKNVYGRYKRALVSYPHKRT